MVTLSVSSSTSGSSTATASPAFLNQRPMVASVTDSPSVGTRISAMICFLNNLRGHAITGQRPPSRGATAGHDNRFLVQRLVEQRLELRQVLRPQTGRGRSRCRASGVPRTLVRRVDLVQHPFEI